MSWRPRRAGHRPVNRPRRDSVRGTSQSPPYRRRHGFLDSARSTELGLPVVPAAHGTKEDPPRIPASYRHGASFRSRRAGAVPLCRDVAGASSLTWGGGTSRTWTSTSELKQSLNDFPDQRHQIEFPLLYQARYQKANSRRPRRFLTAPASPPPPPFHTPGPICPDYTHVPKIEHNPPKLSHHLERASDKATNYVILVHWNNKISLVPRKLIRET